MTITESLPESTDYLETGASQFDIQADVYERHEHSLSSKEIDEDAQKIMRRLTRHGYLAYLVGGGVRDLLLGKQPKDFDIATDATPSEIRSLFNNCRVIGRRFKLAHIYFRGGKIIEVATFRAATDEVAIEEATQSDSMVLSRDNNFGSEATDAMRRDLTINGLFYDLSSRCVIDYVGGMQDLEHRVVRIIGDPATRYAEDPARMMRVLRHAARANFVIEPETLVAIETHHELLTKCSDVRLFEELKKDLLSTKAEDIIGLLHEHCLLRHLLPEIEVHSEMLLNSQSALRTSLAEVDQEVAAGRLDSATPILALFVLFGAMYNGLIEEGLTHIEALEELPLRCHDDECLAQAMADSFSVLAVPRKEKERIYMTLKLWGNTEWALMRGKKPPFKGKVQLNDAKLLVELLPDEVVCREAIVLIHAAADDYKKGRKSRGKHGARPHHPKEHKPRRRRRRRQDEREDSSPVSDSERFNESTGGRTTAGLPGRPTSRSASGATHSPADAEKPAARKRSRRRRRRRPRADSQE